MYEGEHSGMHLEGPIVNMTEPGQVRREPGATAKMPKGTKKKGGGWM